MNPMDTLHLLAELDGEYCELNHGPGTRREDFPATDYIVQPFGYAEDSIREVALREIVIPVCAECARALLSDEWTLLYCFECCSSQWIYRPRARNRYRHHILWMRGCPECADELSGLFFNDIKAVTGEAVFLSLKGSVAQAA